LKRKGKLSARPRLTSISTHLLTAAAAVEALACLAAMEREALPPTINLDEIDP
jgi:3-oxoacyl-(acyl-carrier-protein) synthase